MNKLTKIIIGSILAIGIIITTYWAAIEYVLRDYQNMPYIVFNYTYSDTGKPREVTIVRIDHNSNYPKNFEVPEKLLGYPVTTIGPNAFAGLERLKTVTLSSNITHIGDGAFQNCENLVEVKSKSKKLTSIGIDVFKNSPNWVGYTQEGLVVLGSMLYLYNGEIEAGTTIKGEEDRKSDDSENTIYLTDNITHIAEGAFANQPGIISFSFPSRFHEVSNNLLRNCVNLQKVELDQIKRIGNNAFSGCTSLNEVILNPDIIEEIGNYAFKGTDLKSFEFSQNITGIGDGVFQDCEMLESVEIPSSITSIGDDAFNGCISLTTIEKTIPGNQNNDLSNISVIGERAFKGSGLKSITLPENVAAIQKEAFQDCISLESITLPEVAEKIDDNGEVILDEYLNPSYTGIEIIGDAAFKNTPKLESITFPAINKKVGDEDVIVNTLTGIGISAFENSGIKSIVIPASLIKEISSSAFKDCKQLETVVLQDEKFIVVGTVNPPIPRTTPLYNTIGASAFEGTSKLDEIIIPNSVTAIHDSVFKNSGIRKIKMPDNLTFVTINSSVFENCINLEEIEIPSRVATIKASAFKNCVSLAKITIPSRVTTIEDYAFSGCNNLTTVTFTAGNRTAIGNSAFSGCSELTSMTIPFVGNTLVGTSNTHFGYIFGAPSYLENSLYVPATLKEIVILGGTKIADNAFYGCNELTTVTIPKTVTSVGKNIFSGCDKLTTIYVNGYDSKPAGWDNDWISGCSATVIWNG